MRCTSAEHLHHLSRWRASGVSRAAYCREHGLPYQAFLAWTKRDIAAGRPDASASGFIELLDRRSAGASAPGAMPAAATIVLPGGMRVEVAPTADPRWIAQLVATVRSC